MCSTDRTINTARTARFSPHIVRGIMAGLLVFAFSPCQADDGYVFTAPPRETPSEGKKIYEPIADLLTKAVGKKWTYRHPGNWLKYVKMVVNDEADAHFGEPHFTGYLVLYHHHQLLARLEQDDEWILVAKKGNKKFQLAGRPTCLLPPPNIANLSYTSQPIFDNPTRLPYVVISTDPDESVDFVSSGRCMYTLISRIALGRLSTGRRAAIETKVLTTTPGQAISIKGEFDPQTTEKIKNALLSTEGQKVTQVLRDRFAEGAALVAVADIEGYLFASSMLVNDYLIPMKQTDSAFALADQAAKKARADNKGKAGKEEWLNRVDPLLAPDVRALQTLANNQVIRDAVKSQNSKRVSLDKIKQIDKEWKGTKELTPFKRSLQGGNAGILLKQTVVLNAIYGELFLTDNQGANVATYPATSDYWQGDEAKFTESFKGGGRVFVGPVEYDDSSKSVSIQISVPVFDEANRVIGVLVGGVILDYVEWKKKRG